MDSAAWHAELRALVADTPASIVLIGRGLPPHGPARLLDAIGAEVREDAARVLPE